MIIRISIETSNDAFAGDEYVEVARILREWAVRIPADGYGAKLRDYNGNTVGEVILLSKKRTDH